MKNLSLVKKISFSFLAVFLVLLFIVVFVNISIFDEELEPEVVNLLQPIVMPRDEDNAFYAIWGLEAATHMNMVETGKALILNYQLNKDRKEHDGLSPAKDLDIHWKEEIENCVARKQSNCSSLLNAQLHEIPIKSERLELMLARYRQVIAMQEFQQIDDYTITSPLPPYGTLMKLKRINLAQALDISDFKYFYAILKNDLVFWKMLLLKGDSLLDKMIAVASIWSDLHTISEYVTKHNITSIGQLSDLRTLLNPLTPEELNIGESYIFEQRAFDKYLTSYANDKTSRPLNWLFQPKATLNAYNRLFTQQLVQLSAQSRMDFYETIRETHNGKLVCCFKELEQPRPFSPSSIYNYGGKLLLSNSSFQAQDYIARVHDLNGMLSLMRLKLSLQSIDKSALTSTILKSKERDPYDNQPMDYNEIRATLGFNCLDKSSVCLIEL